MQIFYSCLRHCLKCPRKSACLSSLYSTSWGRIKEEQLKYSGGYLPTVSYRELSLFNAILSGLKTIYYTHTHTHTIINSELSLLIVIQNKSMWSHTSLKNNGPVPQLAQIAVALLSQQNYADLYQLRIRPLKTKVIKRNNSDPNLTLLCYLLNAF